MKNGLLWINENTPELTALSQAIWEYAEVGLKEQRSSEVLKQFIQKNGFKIETGVGGIPTAFTASFGEGKPVIGLLGEFDALPGLSQKALPHLEPVETGGPGHGCGHNLLGVGSLAAAIALKHEVEAGRLQGTVRYYGCPAEEIAIGKVFMARDGLFDDLDAALTWHPDSLNMVNSATSLALNSVRFAFHGKASHAAGAPHLGISALDAVELMNVGTNYLREHVPQETRFHYVTTSGGKEPNVVPSYAEVWYYIRAPHREDVETVYQRITKIAEGASLMTGATLEIKFQTGLYDNLPNQVLTDLLDESLKEVGVHSFTETEEEFARKIDESFSPGQKRAVFQVYHIPTEFMEVTLHENVAPDLIRGERLSGSTDVGDVSWIVPTGQIMTACYVLGTMPHSWQAVAAAGSSIGYKGMITAARALAFAGYQLITRPELLAKAREEFIKARGNKTYHSPLPSNLKPPLND